MGERMAARRALWGFTFCGLLAEVVKANRRHVRGRVLRHDAELRRQGHGAVYLVTVGVRSGRSPLRHYAALPVGLPMSAVEGITDSARTCRHVAVWRKADL